MVKIHTDVEQGDLRWLRLRLGKVTASELGNLLTPEFKPRTGEMVHTYLCGKVAEAWRGEPLPAFGSWATDQGAIREDEAIPFFELQYDCEIQRVGFIEGEDGRCGCSPDGLIGDDCGIEIKCPESVNHVKYLLGGGVPKEYAAQVHGSIYMSGRKWWTFFSYRRKFPPLLVKVERDEAIMEKIAAVLTAFYSTFDAAMLKLQSIADADGFARRASDAVKEIQSVSNSVLVDNWRPTI